MAPESNPLQQLDNWSKLTLKYFIHSWENLYYSRCNSVIFLRGRYETLQLGIRENRLHDISSYTLSTYAFSTAAISTAAISTAHNFNLLHFQLSAISTY